MVFSHSAYLKLIALIVTLGLSIDVRGETPFSPVSELCQDGNFQQFRNSLSNAIEIRDRGALISLLSPEIKSSFGGDNTISEFESIWFSKDTRNDIWQTLDWILRHGGKCSNGAEFSAPYVYSNWPTGLDAFEYVAIVGSNVNVRAEPNVNSAVLTTLSYSTIALSGQDPFAAEWVRVELGNGTIGYISRHYARSSLDYRLIASKVAGNWMITALIAGD